MSEMGTQSVGDSPRDVVVLSVSESHELFDKRARQLTGMSRAEFLAALTAGEFSAEDGCGHLAPLLTLLPFATCQDK